MTWALFCEIFTLAAMAYCACRAAFLAGYGLGWFWLLVEDHIALLISLQTTAMQAHNLQAALTDWMAINPPAATPHHPA